MMHPEPFLIWDDLLPRGPLKAFYYLQLYEVFHFLGEIFIFSYVGCVLLTFHPQLTFAFVKQSCKILFGVLMLRAFAGQTREKML